MNAAVDPPGSIQAAIDSASSGDHICLSGTFVNEPTVTIDTSHITIRAGSEAALDGGRGPAFSFAGGVSHVTIRDLEIRNRVFGGGLPKGVIEASGGATSHITIRSYYIHDNGLSGIRVTSLGDFVHDNWKVEENVVVSNGERGHSSKQRNADSNRGQFRPRPRSLWNPRGSHKQSG